MKILTITPPMIQLNTPYPAAGYLTSFMCSRGFKAVQEDLAIELVVRLFSRKGLERVAEVAQASLDQSPRNVDSCAKHFIKYKTEYFRTIDSVMRFLQGRDDTFATQLTRDGFLPQGRRFLVNQSFKSEAYGQGTDELEWAFGSLGDLDRARYLASLYIDDIADVVRECVDESFELSKYGERLAAAQPSFDPLEKKLLGKESLIDTMIREIVENYCETHKPDVVALTVPFPGNVYGALKIAQVFKQLIPEIKVIMGGGYCNTELRDLKDPRIFDYVDFITLDDGFKPILQILTELNNTHGVGIHSPLLRTFLRRDGYVVFVSVKNQHDIPFNQSSGPSYIGLKLKSYVSMVEMLNPMHRLWSNGRWNKLVLAHGCYWKGCSFCDLSLDYISRYEEQGIDEIIDQIERIIEETGETGFHFVDEAAPPKVLLALAKRLLERSVQISWWGNVRFEKTFTPKVANILAKSGCIAITGGLEVASDRLLKLMNKGVTVEQVARVTKAFTDAGVLVHAYLMYGFPTQTVQETLDSLERVRQLFDTGCLQSAYWHRFVATVHSPVGKNPEQFGIKITSDLKDVTFARNDLTFFDPIGVDHDLFGPGLQKAVYNFMYGIGLDWDVREWFEFSVPKAKVKKDLVESAIAHLEV